jgi:hypothetical protein
MYWQFKKNNIQVKYQKIKHDYTRNLLGYKIIKCIKNQPTNNIICCYNDKSIFNWFWSN